MKRQELLESWKDELGLADYHLTRAEVYRECGEAALADDEILYAKQHLTKACGYLNQAAEVIS